MKIIILQLTLCLAFIFCKPTKEMNGDASRDAKSATTDTITIANEELDYEVIIVEIGFNRYLRTQPNADYYSETFLENKNLLYVQEYNRRVLNSMQSRELYPQEINYDPRVHYGKEVNFLLYNYFKFFEQKYKQRLR